MGGFSGGGGMGGVSGSQIGSTVGGIANYYIQRGANNNAYHHLTDAQNRANALYTEQFGKTEGSFKPWIEGGQSAWDALQRSYGLGAGQNGQADYSGFYNAPDYQFAAQQGQQQLDRSAAAKGRLFSGAQQKATMDFGQDLASRYLGNYRSGLAGMANVGYGATNALAGYRQNYADQLGQGYTNLGDISAGRDLGNAAAFRQFYQDMNETWGAGPTGNSGGGNGGGGMSFFSDRRLKTDIARVGTLDNGLPVYTYRYKGDARVFMGVMADEVESIKPEAVSTHASGYKMVDYGKVA